MKRILNICFLSLLKFSLLAFIVFWIVPAAFAQTTRILDAEGNAIQLDFESPAQSLPAPRVGTAQKIQTAISSLPIVEAALGFSAAEFKLAATQGFEDHLGWYHQRIERSLHGIKIFPDAGTLHIAPSGELKRASLALSDVPDQTKETLLITEDLATSIAQAEFASTLGALNSSVLGVELVYVNPQQFELAPLRASESLQLAWAVDLLELTAPAPTGKHYVYFIGAGSAKPANLGRIILTLSKTFDARTILDCSLAPQNGGFCVFDFVNGQFRFGRGEGSPPAGVNPIYGFTDTDGTYDTIANSLTYLQQRFSRNGANGVGGISNGQVYPAADTRAFTYLDPFPSVGCPNAFYNNIDLNFCSQFGSIANIVAHEYVHALTEHSAQLIYQSESGALNESFSDIFGNAIDVFVTGQTTQWTIGGPLGPQFSRSLSDPTQFIYGATNAPYPDRFHSPNFYCGALDNAGVHGNSSVLNKGAFLIADGGIFNNCNIIGIGRLKMEQIAFRALTVYLLPNSNFNATFNAFVQAATDLFGPSSQETVTTKKALMAVELNQPGQCSGQSANAPTCSSVSEPGGPTPTPGQPTPTPTITPTRTPTPTPTPTQAGGSSPTPIPTNTPVPPATPPPSGTVTIADPELISINYSKRTVLKSGTVRIETIVTSFPAGSLAQVILIPSRGGKNRTLRLNLVRSIGNGAVLRGNVRLTFPSGKSSAALRYRGFLVLRHPNGNNFIHELPRITVKPGKL